MGRRVGGWEGGQESKWVAVWAGEKVARWAGRRVGS